MSTEPKKRKYQEAWEQIKKTGKLTIIAKAIVHARIVKAVKKEKWSDTAFKLCNEHDYFFLEIATDARMNRIDFKLRQRYGLEGVKNEPSL